MKFMNFTKSCSYAALANMLLEFQIDVEDFEIALKINLPYMFQYSEEESGYIAGPLLQGKKWFDYYLNTLGLMFIENSFSQTEVLKFLESRNLSCMIGLNFETTKHALVYQGMHQNKYSFLNPHHKGTNVLTSFLFDRDELLEKLEEITHIGFISSTQNISDTNNINEIKVSLNDLARYKENIYNFCHSHQEYDALKASMDSLFAAPFLHLVSMMNIIQNTEISNELISLRTQYLNALRKEKNLRLSDHIDYKQFENVLDKYAILLNKKVISK